MINIREDGTVEVDKEGIEALDKIGHAWISKKVRIRGEDSTSIVMIRR